MLFTRGLILFVYIPDRVSESENNLTGIRVVFARDFYSSRCGQTGLFVSEAIDFETNNAERGGRGFRANNSQLHRVSLSSSSCFCATALDVDIADIAAESYFDVDIRA